MSRSDRDESGIVAATARYETRLANRIPLIAPDLELKHRAMSAGSFPFFRATFYRWAARWEGVVGAAAQAPRVLAVGDLHVENFGTWRDAEGRLIWGVNDFDEAWPLPYTQDVVRLAASALVAGGNRDLTIESARAVQAILDGYREALETGGHAFVLAEHHAALREMALHRLHSPEGFWDKLDGLPTLKTRPPAAVRAVLDRALPQRDLKPRIVHRVAGLGSLGRQRFVALARWHGGLVAREAKALAPSACGFAGRGRETIHYAAILRRAVRCPDPCVAVRAPWLVRRLAPDCSRIPLSALPRERDEERLLHAMGWEAANVHLGSPSARLIGADLKRRPNGWLYEAASRMADAVDHDWRQWRKARGAD